MNDQLKPWQIRSRRRRRSDGQALVEFSIALIPFLFLLMGTVDLGRGIYSNNGVAQAAREIARVTSVHQCVGPCTTASWSAETLGVVNTQRQLVPGLSAADIAITCVDVTDTAVTVAAGKSCPPYDFIRVTASVSFSVITPLLPVPKPMTFSSTAHVQVP
ncbi:MAG: pilus assembly protein [Chloroflexi bacterium]|nr:pilus assembly protein [Chloroflexota bacterium]